MLRMYSTVCFHLKYRRMPGASSLYDVMSFGDTLEESTKI